MRKKILPGRINLPLILGLILLTVPHSILTSEEPSAQNPVYKNRTRESRGLLDTIKGFVSTAQTLNKLFNSNSNNNNHQSNNAHRDSLAGNSPKHPHNLYGDPGTSQGTNYYPPNYYQQSPSSQQLYSPQLNQPSSSSLYQQQQQQQQYYPEYHPGGDQYPGQYPGVNQYPSEAQFPNYQYPASLNQIPGSSSSSLGGDGGGGGGGGGQISSIHKQGQMSPDGTYTVPLTQLLGSSGGGLGLLSQLLGEAGGGGGGSSSSVALNNGNKPGGGSGLGVLSQLLGGGSGGGGNNNGLAQLLAAVGGSGGGLGGGGGNSNALAQLLAAAGGAAGGLGGGGGGFGGAGGGFGGAGGGLGVAGGNFGGVGGNLGGAGGGLGGAGGGFGGAGGGQGGSGLSQLQGLLGGGGLGGGQGLGGGLGGGGVRPGSNGNVLSQLLGGSNSLLPSALNELGIFEDLAGLFSLGNMEKVVKNVNQFDSLKCIPRMVCQTIARRQEEAEKREREAEEEKKRTSTTTTTRRPRRKNSDKRRQDDDDDSSSSSSSSRSSSSSSGSVRKGRFLPGWKVQGVDTALEQFVKFLDLMQLKDWSLYPYLEGAYQGHQVRRWEDCADRFNSCPFAEDQLLYYFNNYKGGLFQAFSGLTGGES